MANRTGRKSSEAVLYLSSRLLWEPPNTYIASTFASGAGGLKQINSSDNKCLKSALTWLALLVFSHMMDNVKANKALNEMKNIGFEKMRCIALEFIILATDPHRLTRTSCEMPVAFTSRDIN